MRGNTPVTIIWRPRSLLRPGSGYNAGRLSLIYGHDGPGRPRYFAGVAVAFDGSRHPLAIARDSCVAYIARPRLANVSRSIHCGGHSGTKRDGTLALQI